MDSQIIHINTVKPADATISVGAVERNPYAARLIAWVLLLNAFVLAVRFVPGLNLQWTNHIWHTLLEVCGAMLCGGIAYGLWMQYCVSLKRQTLLATVAFSGFMTTQLTHALSFAMAFGGWKSVESFGHQVYSLWILLAGILLSAAALNNSEDNPITAKKIGLRWIWGVQAASLLSVVAVLFLAGAGSSRWFDLSAPEFDRIRMAAGIFSSQHLLHALDSAALIVALILYARRFIQDEDVVSGGIVRCLALAATGMTGALLSRHESDMLWWLSHVFAVAAVIALVAEMARDFGQSYANAAARIEHLEAVHKMSAHLGNTLDLRVVLLVLASDVGDVLQARYASVMLADDSGQTLRTVSTFGLPESPLKVHEPQMIEGGGRPAFFTGHTARAFREKRIVTAEDVFTDVEFVPWRLLARSNGYTVSVPLVYHDVALGIINLFFDAHVPINAERMRLFETLAASAAVSIANAQLYERTLEEHPSDTDASHLFRLRLAS